MKQSLPTFKDRAHVEALLRLMEERHTSGRTWHIMEICGGQTHAIARYRLEELLPPWVQTIHGPGCPVCVTAESVVAEAIAIARRKGVIFTTFGDMLRVPGGDASLLSARAEGADVQMIYSPLDAVRIAADNPKRQVVLFGIGFETTAPVHALALQQARRMGLTNFSFLSALVSVPPAVELLMSDPDCRIDALLAAGHVCAVTGYESYHDLARRHRLPICVTGFEPVDILWGMLHSIEMLESGTYEVQNAYARIVGEQGNLQARRAMDEVFEPCNREWRGMGVIPQSGFRLRESYARFDASERFAPYLSLAPLRPSSCRSGDLLRGKLSPFDCPDFGTRCTPERPLGAAMVSSEGVCAAYHRYHSHPHIKLPHAL
jgi:hydrogenase expression/formation protein HypD